jgi:hypothetical protein
MRFIARSFSSAKRAWELPTSARDSPLEKMRSTAMWTRRRISWVVTGCVLAVASASAAAAQTLESGLSPEARKYAAREPSEVVETADGILMTYAKTPFDDAQWRLLRA